MISYLQRQQMSLLLNRKHKKMSTVKTVTPEKEESSSLLDNVKETSAATPPMFDLQNERTLEAIPAVT
ncbi:unnamed protein product [Euphydryas editha]|uniref:Uncharacterized protein n=1 Tax=Euphydryas editha TaxID=104508 RepID=A0AAU9TWH1_EUPED|nr:unnamed protein product [Euphydryas editha]